MDGIYSSKNRTILYKQSILVLSKVRESNDVSKLVDLSLDTLKSLGFSNSKALRCFQLSGHVELFPAQVVDVVVEVVRD